MAKRNPHRATYDSDRLSFLASEVMRHKRLYYAGKPEIADVEYDRLEEELRQMSPNHPVLTSVGSLTSDSGNKKVTHDHPMLSLAKTYDLTELLAWVEKRAVVGTLKVDGTSMSLLYRGGQLVLAKTRGNGREGEDVTTKLRWVSDAIPEIGSSLDCEIRGELYCSESNFVKLVAEMNSLGLERPSSPRNIVAGIMGRKIHGELARYFNFFAFDVLNVKQFATEVEKFSWLEGLGFRLPEPRLLETDIEIKSYLNFVKKIISEDEVGCDGAVFSYNQLSLHDDLGVTSHHPRYKLSFKWQGETARSQIIRVEWATSRLGIVTPVAVIDPVSLSGALISNITLHNAAHVRSFNLKAGDSIELVRSGEVIPKFLSVVSSSAGDCLIPDTCPSCGSTLESDEVRIRCRNKHKCKAQLQGMILNWIKAVGIDDLSDKRLQIMLEIGLIKSIPDLYKLTISDLLTMPVTKDKMAQKLLDNIQKTKDTPLAMFLNGLGIEGTGQTTWEKILESYPSLAQIRKLSAHEIAELDGFAERSALQITEGLAENGHLIDEILSVGVRPITSATSQNGPLMNQIFVITGALSRSRKDVEDAIKSAGGRMSSSVSKNITALITNEVDSTSSKMQKAKSLGVKVWSEEDLMKHIKNHGL